MKIVLKSNVNLSFSLLVKKGNVKRKKHDQYLALLLYIKVQMSV